MTKEARTPLFGAHAAAKMLVLAMGVALLGLASLPVVALSESEKSNGLCQLEAAQQLPAKQRLLVAQAASALPCELLQSLAEIRILARPNMPRAMAGASLLVLRDDFFTLPEAEAVLIHEFAHILDLGGLRGTPNGGKSAFLDGAAPIFANDPSVDFYQISWEDSKAHREEATSQDFISGYAMHSPFEDFSESTAAYILHGGAFRLAAAANAPLAKKYAFLRDRVFGGVEFGFGEASTKEKTTTISAHPIVAGDKRPWDITKLAFSF